MHRSEIDSLDPTRPYWVPAVVAPHRDWAGAPGCRSGARFLIDLPDLGGAARLQADGIKTESLLAFEGH